jgi:hypothetical protein
MQNRIATNYTLLARSTHYQNGTGFLPGVENANAALKRCSSAVVRGDGRFLFALLALRLRLEWQRESVVVGGGWEQHQDQLQNQKQDQRQDQRQRTGVSVVHERRNDNL